MEHLEMVQTIAFIRPNAQFVLRGYELEWLDENQKKPTKSEIDKGFVEFKAWKIAEESKQADAKSALLARLGITAEEAVLLLS